MAVNWMSVLSTRSTVTIPRTSGWTLSVNMLNTSIVTLSVFSVPNGKRATAQVPIPNPSGSATPSKKIIPVTELAWWDCTTHQIEFHHSNSVAIGIIFTLMSSRICAHITDAKKHCKTSQMPPEHIFTINNNLLLHQDVRTETCQRLLQIQKLLKKSNVNTEDDHCSHDMSDCTDQNKTTYAPYVLII